MNILLKLKKDLMQVMLKHIVNIALSFWVKKKGKKIFSKQNWILLHLKKYPYFVEKTIPNIKDQIFSLSKDYNNEKQNKQSCKLIDFCIIF